MRNGSNQSEWLYVGTRDISGGGLNEPDEACY